MDEHKETIIRMLEEGHTLAHTCRTLGLDYQVVYREIRKWPINKPRHQEILKLSVSRFDRHKAQIAKLVEEGVYVAEIGRRLGLSETTVRNYVYKLGLKPPRKCKMAQHRDIIIRLMNEGLCVAQVARVLGTKPETTRQYVNELQITPQKKLERHKDSIIRMLKEGYTGHAEVPVDKVKELYDQGWKQDEIAEKLDTRQNRISNILINRCNKRCINKRKHDKPPEVTGMTFDFPTAKYLWEQGYTQDQIGKAFGVTQSVVSTMFIKNDFKRMNRKPRKTV